MKKLLGLILALSIFLPISNANASCDGIYLGVRGGIVEHNLGDPDESMGDRLDIGEKAGSISGALGYRYGYWRFEAEYIWRAKTSEEENDFFAAKADFETQSYMFNVIYDFSPYTMFTPYIMAGVGMSHIEYKFSNIFFDETVESDNFTWAIGGGLSAKMTNRWNIDLGYRFFNMGDLEDATVRAHEFYLGTRYVF